MELALGAAVLALTVLALIDAAARRRGSRLFRRASLTPAARRAVMAVLSAGSAAAAVPALVPALRRGTFAFCSVCPVSPLAAAGSHNVADFLRVTLLGAWYYAATVIPIFVLACLLSGALAVATGRFPIRGVWRSFGLAALLPVCSCGTVPIGKAMVDSGGTGPRDGIIFLASAPLLSPVIVVLAVSVLGPAYAVARIVGSAAVALAAGWFVTPFVNPQGSRARLPGCSGCDVAASGDGALASGWSYLTSLIRFALYGVALGALFTAALPPATVAAIVRPGIPAMAAAVVVGIPINMCGGEEILLSAPLVGMGFTLGHALAFGLASTGICLGSIPLLAAALGRKAVLALVAVYLLVPFLLGLLFNALPVPPAFGPRPF